MKKLKERTPTVENFLEGKSEQTLMLFNHFVNAFQQLAPVTLHPAKTMIGISNGRKRIAWITALGKNFVHIVFPFSQPYHDNLCFTKIAQVPGTTQYNHHFRMLSTDDVNDEVVQFMKRALENAERL